MAENNEFLREVDEDYRRDRILQIWKRYSGVIIALAVLVVAGVAAFYLLGQQSLWLRVIALLVLIAGGATILFVRRRWRAATTG